MDTPASPLKTLLLVALVASGSALLVTASYEFSKDRILENERARLLANLHSVLDPALRSSGLVPTHLSVPGDELLGTDDPVDVFVVAPADGPPVATIFASSAPEGYNAPIRLLVGVSSAGELTGVRVLSHRETPGLGDAIDLEKSSWILQFDGRSLGNPPQARWRVDKDGGDLDGLTGATITARAVVDGVRDTLLYFERHRDELFAQAARADAAATNGD